MSDNLIEQENPKFKVWRLSQPSAVQTAIANEWAQRSAYPDIDPGSTHADYARLSCLIQWCVATYGYQP